MNCIHHPDSQAYNTCGRCGVWLCDSCAVTVNGRVVCKRCIANVMDAHSGAGYGTPEPFSVNSSHGEPRREGRPRRYISGLWIFMLSCLPGLNYMAMGLMKRGLFFMSAFFGIIFLMGTLHFLAFPLTILFFASLCDSQSKRRRINSGEHVPDDIDDIMRFATKHKTLLLVVFAFLVLVRISNIVFIIVLCLLGWYFIRGRNGKSSSNDSTQ